MRYQGGDSASSVQSINFALVLFSIILNRFHVSYRLGISTVRGTAVHKGANQWLTLMEIELSFTF